MKKPENLQDYFNNAWEWFVVMGNGPSFRLSIDDDGTEVYCYYRSGCSGKCAIGASIMDEDYDPKLEGRPATSVLEAIGYPIPDDDAIYELQDCHDDLLRPHHPIPDNFAQLIKKNLEDFAEIHELSIPA